MARLRVAVLIGLLGVTQAHSGLSQDRECGHWDEANVVYVRPGDLLDSLTMYTRSLEALRARAARVARGTRAAHRLTEAAEWSHGTPARNAVTRAAVSAGISSGT